MSTLENFRIETAAWLDANCPMSQRQPILKDEQIWAGKNRTFASADAQAWFEAMRDRGWTAPEWPIEYGGGGLSAEQAKILQKEMARLHCRPPLYDLGLWMLGPALLTYGDETQKAEHLPRIVRGEARWAQGYSEPSAGSDLASLKTRADDEGDHFLVNGTKIWTTRADLADWIFCLVRTNTGVPKQQGISFLLIDMESQGVSTTPIKLISGESEFCQTFFDNVKVPKSNLVGELDNGWAVAKELLKHERKLMASMDAIVQKVDIGVVELARQKLPLTEDGTIADTELRNHITRHLMNDDAMQALNERMFLQHKSGMTDARLPLLIKHIGTAELQRKDEILLSILGDEGLSLEADEDAGLANIVQTWAYDKAHTIAGGTSEVQLNIIAKRALGLPT